jgi:hypothetical protein
MLLGVESHRELAGEYSGDVGDGGVGVIGGGGAFLCCSALISALMHLSFNLNFALEDSDLTGNGVLGSCVPVIDVFKVLISNFSSSSFRCVVAVCLESAERVPLWRWCCWHDGGKVKQGW